MQNYFSLLVILTFSILGCQENNGDLSETTASIIVEEPLIDSLGPFSLVVNGRIQSGFRNKAEKKVIPAIFDMAGAFYGKTAPVVLGSEHGFCDSSGTIIYPLIDLKFETISNEWNPFSSIIGNSEGLFLVRDTSNLLGYVNSHGEIVIPCEFDEAQAFIEGFAAVSKPKEGFGFINTSGALIVPFKYDTVHQFNEGMATVKLGNNYGFVNTNGELALPTDYKSATIFMNGYAIVSDTESDDSYYYINQKGEKIINDFYERALPFMNGQAAVNKNDTTLIINEKGEILEVIDGNLFDGC